MPLSSTGSPFSLQRFVPITWRCPYPSTGLVETAAVLVGYNVSSGAEDVSADAVTSVESVVLSDDAIVCTEVLLCSISVCKTDTLEQDDNTGRMNNIAKR